MISSLFILALTIALWESVKLIVREVAQAQIFFQLRRKLDRQERGL